MQARRQVVAMAELLRRRAVQGPYPGGEAAMQLLANYNLLNHMLPGTLFKLQTRFVSGNSACTVLA